MVAGGGSGGLRGGGSQPPPTVAPVGSRGAGAGGGRWISTPGWGPSPVGFAKLPVSHGRRAGEAAGAWGAGGAAGAPGAGAAGAGSPEIGFKGLPVARPRAPPPPEPVPLLLPASLGVQPPRGVFSSWGLPAGPGAWGRSRDGSDGFPARLRRGRTGVTLWLLCPPRGWDRGLETILVSPWGPLLCWRDTAGEMRRQVLVASLDFGIRHQLHWATDVTRWHQVHRAGCYGVSPAWHHRPGVTAGCRAEKLSWQGRDVPKSQVAG